MLGWLFATYASDVYAWAASTQRDVQNQLARAVMAIRTGDAYALAWLVGLSWLYGVVHAVGPGHGKVLIGGAAAATQATARRMAAIGFAASLVQAVTAIVLIYGALGLLAVTSGWAIGTTERVLVPASYAAMGAIGVWLAWRGITMLARNTAPQPAAEQAGGHVGVHGEHTHHHAHDHQHGHRDDAHVDGHGHHHGHHHHGHDCGCKHMPTADEAAALNRWQDIAALVLSIGIRPCSGALIVLVITWKFGLYAAGAASAFAMAVGTGLVVAGVAVFATALRRLIAAREDQGDARRGLIVLGGLQLSVGLAIAAVCTLAVIASLTAPASSGLLR